VKGKIKRLLDAVESGSLDQGDITQRMAEHRLAKGTLEAQIEKIEDQLSKLPTREEVKSRVEEMEGEIRHTYFGSKKRLSEMSFEEKRRLLDLLFVNTTPDEGGKKPGIYLKRTRWGVRYIIRGIFKEPITEIMDSGIIRNGRVSPGRI
jgi:hypothetical protein